MSPSWNSISVVSFKMGRRPEWWIPIPLFSRGSTCSTWGSNLSSSERQSMAFVKTSSTKVFSSAEGWKGEEGGRRGREARKGGRGKGGRRRGGREGREMRGERETKGGTGGGEKGERREGMKEYNLNTGVSSSACGCPFLSYQYWSPVWTSAERMPHSLSGWSWIQSLAAAAVPLSSWPPWSSWSHAAFLSLQLSPHRPAAWTLPSGSCLHESCPGVARGGGILGKGRGGGGGREGGKEGRGEEGEGKEEGRGREEEDNEEEGGCYPYI